MAYLSRRARLAVLVCLAALIAALLPAGTVRAAPTHYITMSDGVSIAVNIRMPDDFQKGRTYPTIFEMSGYDGGSSDGTTPGNAAGEGSRGLTKIFNQNYVTIHASIRGTGCSGGEFDLFSWRSALDGREIIEWIALQPWSNGKVGVYGHSYGGLTGFMVAATRPPHLTAVSVSGLIDDLYRGIVYPGGVSNYGFPLLWTGVVRPLYDVGGGTFPGLAAGDQQCMQNVATHSRTVLNDPIIQGTQDTDNGWWQARALINYAERIEVPIHITGAFQDEQTGPRGPYHLFEEVTNAPARRLVMTNGDHGTQTGPQDIWRDRRAWMDYWMRDVGGPFARSSVTTWFDRTDKGGGARKDSRTFPLEDTRWTDAYLHAEGRLTFQAPKGRNGADSYFAGSPRQSWSYQAGHRAGSPVTTSSGPDELVYATGKLQDPLVIAGPMTATFYVSSTAVDTDIFVQIMDVAPDGSTYYLQRGMLKASHRAIDEGLSDRLADGTIYRPHRPHTNPTLIEPGRVYQYLVEIFPVAHIFRPGHRLVVKIHTPPAVDSYYAYVPERPPAINTIYHDEEHHSRLMLPIVPIDFDLGPAPKACSLTAVRCV